MTKLTMKLTFKMQKAWVKQQEEGVGNGAIKMEDSALLGLASVAVAVEEADSKSAFLDTIKLEREDSMASGNGAQDLSTQFKKPTDSSSNCSSVSHPKASSPLTSESKTDVTDKLPLNRHPRTTVGDNQQHSITVRASSEHKKPLEGHDVSPTQLLPPHNQEQQQQQVRVIKDGRFYEGTHTDLPCNLSQSALLTLHGKQDLRITQITKNSDCKKGATVVTTPPHSNGHLVNVITIGNGKKHGPLALDTVKMKLGENDTQIFRTPMVSSTTSQSPSSVADPTAHPGIVVTVESSDCSMRPPAVPPRPHHVQQTQQQQQQQLHGNGGSGNKMVKHPSPSSTTQHHQNLSEEPSSSIPDLGKCIHS